MIKLTTHDFSVDEVVNQMKSSSAGCVVTFVGVVRGVSQEDKVKRLEFESHRKLALEKLSEIEQRARKRFVVENVTIIHRMGKLKVSENILLIAVSAAHRKPAFLACQYILEELKRSVPIWKKEITTAGEERWVENP